MAFSKQMESRAFCFSGTRKRLEIDHRLLCFQSVEPALQQERNQVQIYLVKNFVFVTFLKPSSFHQKLLTGAED